MAVFGDSKVNPAPFIGGHLRTMVDARTGRTRPADLITLYGAPVAVGGLALWRVDDLRMAASTAGGLLAATGVFGAFLFQLSLQLLDRAGAWSDSLPTPSAATSRQAQLLGELAAHAAYASFVAAAASGVLLAAAIADEGTFEHLLTAMALTLVAHLALTVLLVLRRSYLLTIDRLRRARTGADLT